MAEARIERYFADSDNMLKRQGNAAATKALLGELKKLTVFLQKNQGEKVTPGAQTKLLMTVERYYHFASSPSCKDDDVIEASLAMITDLLCLPEGRLVSAKAKQKAISWQRNLTAIATDTKYSAGTGSIDAASATSVWTVIDVTCDCNCEDNPDSSALIRFTLMDGNDDIIENIKAINTELALKIKGAFESSIAEEREIKVEVTGSPPIHEPGDNVLILAMM